MSVDIYDTPVPSCRFMLLTHIILESFYDVQNCDLAIHSDKLYYYTNNILFIQIYACGYSSDNLFVQKSKVGEFHSTELSTKKTLKMFQTKRKTIRHRELSKTELICIITFNKNSTILNHKH